ncbi:serine hydrolase [Leptolyngbya sp. 7M]|uniref:serine hydrolase n=1 Tax=Leptolyngbya sp. 7M TaxID=2812896 RepID=UPI001B8AA553|nr:serine hydrolase [Leptolyngbya sp. 7M]QYO67191.1 class A beta-lactamase-related serine hydrolase [Leptolyngbya sp. 7M]
MKVKFTHKEFSNNPERQYENWATPRAAVALLKELHEYPEDNNGEIVAPPRILSSEDVKFLRRLMTETPTGPNRLKGELPKGVVVIHKTGTSGTVDGKTAATKDIGLIQLPDGRYFAIAVFVGDSTADEQTREAVIARIAKAVWDDWKE